MINSIVIDTETMDVRPTALILSIGAFAFDVTNQETTQADALQISKDQDLAQYSPTAFYGFVDTYDQLMLCRTVSRDTQQWWRNVSEDAHEALAGERLPLSTQLINLSGWINQHSNARIFFRGTDFDGSILESAYRVCGIECPWRYNGKRDIRTYIDALTKGYRGYIEEHQPSFMMIKHHSLHDAMNDAEQMCIAYTRCQA